MLRGIDTLVFDLQNIGCRSYTYISTMTKCIEAAAEKIIFNSLCSIFRAGIPRSIMSRPV
jgi:hypothetical protein